MTRWHTYTTWMEVPRILVLPRLHTANQHRPVWYTSIVTFTCRSSFLSSTTSSLIIVILDQRGEDPELRGGIHNLCARAWPWLQLIAVSDDCGAIVVCQLVMMTQHVHEIQTSGSPLLLRSSLLCKFLCNASSQRIIYLVIIQNRGKPFTNMVGYGIIIPAVCYFPFIVLEHLAIQSRFVRLCLVTTPNIVVFRCIEAMHDTSPAVVETSLGHYVAVLHEPLWLFLGWRDEIAGEDFCKGAWWQALSNCLALSVGIVHDFLLAPVRLQAFPILKLQLDQFHSTPALFAPGHLVNNYLYALLLYFTLALGWNMASLSLNAQGYRTVIPFHNPLFTSKSPSDFWGKKWNVTIHQILKVRDSQLVRHQCVPPAHFVRWIHIWPILHFCSFNDCSEVHLSRFETWATPRRVAILAVLCCFGIAARIRLGRPLCCLPRTTMMRAADCVGRCWYPIVGKQTVFFLWCGTCHACGESRRVELRPVQMDGTQPTHPLWFRHWWSCPFFPSLLGIVETGLSGHYFHDFSVGLFKITYTVDA